MDASDLLAGAGAWTVLAVFTVALAYPLLHVNSRAERLRRREGPPSEPPGLWTALRRSRTAARRQALPRRRGTPSLVRTGYVRLVPDRLAAQMRTMLGAAEARIHVRDPSEPEALIVVAASGGDGDVVGSRVSGGAAEAHALRTGQPVVIPAGEGSSELAAAAAPVTRESSVAGVVSVRARGAAASFALKDLELLCEVAELAGGGLERPARRKALERTADSQASSLATAAELWDGATGPHAGEVLAVARRCGRELGLTAIDQLELELAALLHDVGKIRMPRELLRRPGPLDREEHFLMRLHPVWGAELVAQVPGLAAVALVIRHHHERMDGHGYPAGLAGHQIPLAARIVTVADAYSTMVEGRPYRAAIPSANAVEELRVHSGGQFDPQVVDALAESLGARGVVVPLPLPAVARA